MKQVILLNPDPIITHDEIFTSRSTEPKVRDVTSKGQDIIDYRIEEAQLDSDDNIITQVDPPFYKTTGRSLDWTIKAGEALKFPEYVANYLKKIYDFIEIKDEVPETTKLEEPQVNVEATAKPVEGRTCKYCGQNFKNTRGLALHIAHRHSDKII